MRNVSNKGTSELTFRLQKIISEICALYEIMWKNSVAPDRPWTTI